MLDIFSHDLDAIRNRYGNQSLHRVEKMFETQSYRDPMQSDAKYILPELSTAPWLETSTFPKLDPLISALNNGAKDIKLEINRALNEQRSVVEKYDHYLGCQPDWEAIYLFKEGKPVHKMAEVIPTAWGILNRELRNWHCPLLEVHFSILHPGALIKPHCDLWNFSINLHLAIDIPEDDCGIIVANEHRNWVEGECLLFDYSYIHEAYNNSNKSRICLLMDIWHPNVTQAEREALVVIIRKIREMLN
ncbi:aspartyl/asparaginyl beta-hydroxylase domain-containing protein [Microbulbifer sp. JMSA004]|uniref:aspartyl/asparaginyl beta-hydroxylase domain-containing protein n=1 Tax=unclassified Microbulbifer TaxID=2619833 RepID=UPI0024AE44D9|nr:aspartyl/asparaginyl beta-hydroxylase domain-containing protein [Microbulbifer sp. VAAF005]WHI44697.1 aspartyl/asparaginyl beta-hydroxylase domain-containing protein [Microbulbifer sp. VAAF005]